MSRAKPPREGLSQTALRGGFCFFKPRPHRVRPQILANVQGCALGDIGVCAHTNATRQRRVSIGGRPAMPESVCACTRILLRVLRINLA